METRTKIFNNIGYPSAIMNKDKLRFRNKTALSYFSIKLINANKLITIEVQINIVLNILKSLNKFRIENADIMKNDRLAATAK
ncbi:hypothetical protein [Chryseobacterium sp.]|uniref:hypothetical protein n=1 Tax=Chryseobacterium sp. TaxID=1871047 RepID=UPI0024E24612|nr:hypothetical protein [Chryseobacterium sp.]